MKAFYKTVVHHETQPAPSPRVARKRAARRARILTVAMRLAAEEGLERLTVTRLAEELDYTAGALYRYFPSKDVLLAEMQRHAIGALHDGLIGRLERHAGDELGSVVALADGYLAMLAEQPECVRLINFMLADPRNLVPDDEVAITAPKLAALLAFAGGVLDRAATAGALSAGNAATRTLMMWTALQGATQLDKMRRFDPVHFDPRAIGRGLFRSLLVGWGADPDAVDHAIAALSEEE